MLLSRASQVVSFTDLQKKTRELLDRVIVGEEDHFVVMRDNKPAAVMMAAERYEALIDELEDLRIEAVTRERLATPSEHYVAEDEMAAFVNSL